MPSRGQFSLLHFVVKEGQKEAGAGAGAVQVQLIAIAISGLIAVFILTTLSYFLIVHRVEDR